MNRKNVFIMFCVLALTIFMVGCSQKSNDVDNKAETTTTEQKSDDAASENKQDDAQGELVISCAASLEKAMEEDLIPYFNETYPNVKVIGSYDSSGKLQAQIEEGANVDVFFSAATKQMNALVDKGFIDKDTVIDLLKNKIVLIAPKDSADKYKTFTDITKANVIALGDPESVPVGQYSKKALTNLKLWDEVEPKLTLGSNVTEVLNWVAAQSADVGIVYASDAAKLKDKVALIDYAPEGSVEDSVYPIGILKNSKNKELAQKFVDTLNSDHGKELFAKYGFLTE